MYKMKILIVSLAKRKITPEMTASRPQIIYKIIKGLAKRGHEVHVIAPGTSIIPEAKLIPVIEKSLVEYPAFENPFYAHTSFLVRFARKIEEIGDNYDIIHNHTYPEFINLLVANKIKTPIITTIHAQATPQLDEVLSLFNEEAYFISISNAHKRLFKKTKIYKVVYNGIDTNLFSFKEEKGDYLLWIGRLSKAKDKKGNFLDPKGVRWAIQLARETGEKLVLTGNVEDMKFFEKDVKPYLNDNIKWYGPISKEQKLPHKEIATLMQNAKAFLMTINWYEPFGLVMAEAMSCGTPVIGFDRGSVSELVIDGKTGFVVPPEKGIDGLKEALKKLDQIDPKVCREHVVKNFSQEKMVENYERVYKEIIKL